MTSRLLLVAALTAGLLTAASLARAVTVPPGFTVENATPSATWSVPVAVQFLPGGRMLVAEKAGRVWTVTNGVKYPAPLVDLHVEVLDSNDRGLLGLAVDPNYATNHWIYLLYTVDPDTNNVDDNDDAFGRLARYTVSFTDSNAIQNGSRRILIGRNWREGIPIGSPSHTIGTIEFGTDGTLFVGTGDGAQFNAMDPGGLDPGLFGAAKTDPEEDIGAFRSQMLTSLAGKLLRVDPATGLGLPNNPFWAGNATIASTNQSRVWAYGLRNPFRFCVRPASGSTDPNAGDPGTVLLGDVGWGTWEEQNVVSAGGRNFGWPCFEGFGPNALYQAASPTHHGCGVIGGPLSPSPPTPPIATWHHVDPGLSVPAGAVGNAAVGGAFYTGLQYPLEYHGAYFFADYGQSWIRAATLDANDQLVNVADFATGADSPVDLTPQPQTGDLYYVSISAGQVRRIRYTGPASDAPPVAVASGSPVVGVAPMTVNFSSSGTFDPENEPFTVSWDFGDQSGSTLANPSHLYTVPGAYAAVLAVEDSAGGVGRDTVSVFVNASGSFPTTGVLDDFDRPNGPLGGAWTGDVTGLQIQSNQLRATAGSNSFVLGAPVLGPTQEAYVTIATSGAAAENNLMLKVQGATWDAGHIEVHFDAQVGYVVVQTYAPSQGWVLRGGPVITPLPSGTQIGARAYGNGVVEVFRNGVRVASVDCSAWPYAANGGRLGLTLTGATASRYDNFGGGDTVLNPNTPPHAVVLAPPDSSFYGDGDTVVLTGSASDAEDPADSLALRWEVDLHHNNHVHPLVHQADGPALSFTAENHDDGTGVWMLGRFVAADRGGRRDTALVHLFPDVDLRPSAVRTQPASPGTIAPATWAFTLANDGRMPAPLSRWRLVAGATVLAEGDTLVPARDSVVVTRVLPPMLAAGLHDVRVTADTLGAVFETDEWNDGVTRTVEVVEGAGPDETPPVFTLGPLATPATTEASIAWRTDEPTTGVVRWGAAPALGDSAMSTAADTAHTVALGPLAPLTRYWYVVAAADTAGHWITSALDSFETRAPTSAAGDPPGRLRLSAARPNPTRGAVAFALELPAPASVTFAVYDLAGREVWRDAARSLAAGRFTLQWSGRDAGGRALPAALYLARVRAGEAVFTRRIALLR